MKTQVAPYETRALCLRIECTDGITIIRLTRYPLDLTMSNGRVYQTGTGFDFTGYQATSSMSPSAIDLEGFVGYAGITRARIASGVFDNARCYLFACDFLNPVEDYEPIVSSILGKVTMEDDKYKIEEMSLVDVLNQSIGKTYTAQCPKTFGGTEYAGCKYPLASCTVTGTITGVTSNHVFTDSTRAEAADYFGLGTIRFTSGLNTMAPDDGGDPYYSSVVLGMHMDGSNDGTTFTDVKGKTVTRYNALTKTGVKHFGNSSAYFDGAGDYLTLADNDGWNFGAGDFTIEAFIHPKVSTGTQVITAQRASDTSQYSHVFYINTGVLYAAFSTTGTSTTHSVVGTKLEVGSFQHVAVVRYGSVLKLYINGEQAGADVDCTGATFFNSTNILTIGGDYTGTSNSFNGYIDNLRITKGVARYTDPTYVVPTAQFPERSATPVSIGTREIKSFGAGGVIEVYEPFYYNVQVGDTYVMTGGCRKRLQDCRDKWNNVVNFGGFSFIPTSSQYSQVGTK